MSRKIRRHDGAFLALSVFTIISFLNVADRVLLSSLKDKVKRDLRLSDTSSSYPTSIMSISFMLFSVIFGYVIDGEHFNRKYLFIISTFSWSIVNSLTYLCSTFTSFLTSRFLIGVFEAAYGSIVTPMLADYFPLAERNTAFGILHLCYPFGAAFGYLISSLIGTNFDWRLAFSALAIPGLLCGSMLFFCANPPRGYFDDEIRTDTSIPSSSSGDDPDPLDQSITPLSNQLYSLASYPEKEQDSESRVYVTDQRDFDSGYPSELNSRFHRPNASSTNSFEIIKSLLCNHHFMNVLLGQTAGAFALSGLSEWIPAYLLRYQHLSIAEVGLILGSSAIFGASLGNLTGVLLINKLQLKFKSPELLVSSIFQIPASLCVFILINIDRHIALVFSTIFLCYLFVSLHAAPISSASINVVPSQLRSTSSAVRVIISGLFGSLLGPLVIGYISDSTHSLRNGLQACWLAILLSAFIWWGGYMYLPPLPVPKHYTENKESSDPSCSCICIANTRSRSSIVFRPLSNVCSRLGRTYGQTANRAWRTITGCLCCDFESGQVEGLAVRNYDAVKRPSEDDTVGERELVGVMGSGSDSSDGDDLKDAV